MSGNFDVASGHRAGCDLLTAFERPDAVFAANDMMALGCMSAFHQAGLRVPSDVAVAGLNDSAMSIHAYPPLSTMRVDISSFGERALHLLLDHPQGGGTSWSTQVSTPELLVRESTRGFTVDIPPA